MEIQKDTLKALVRKPLKILIVIENAINLDIAKVVLQTIPHQTMDIINTNQDFLTIDFMIKNGSYNLIFLGGILKNWIHPKYSEFGPDLIEPIKKMSPDSYVMLMTQNIDTYNDAVREGADGVLYPNEMVDFKKMLQRFIKEE